MGSIARFLANSGPVTAVRRLSSLLLVVLVAGCGGGSTTVQAPPTNESTSAPLAKAAPKAGEIVVRGEASPVERGPVSLNGRYKVRFQQIAPEDPDLDFSQQTPFAARLESAAVDGGQSVKLFHSAAAKGRTTIDEHGRWRIVVEYGDFPFVLRLTPMSGDS